MVLIILVMLMMCLNATLIFLFLLNMPVTFRLMKLILLT